ncbi:MAG TPA: SLC13 family permease [Myxococcales bacterium]|nr:SLC13 family permease [Myxococcales bacterium]HIK84404.1 SLC13 family permease [Myxococcales bacterium]
MRIGYRAPSMDWQIAFTLGMVGLALVAMIRELAAPDLVLMGALVCFGATGILSPSETFAGFANPVVATVGALFVVSAALRETGALDMTLGRVLGRPGSSTRRSIFRMALPVAGLSAFLNNAPIVAMMTPTVIDWARRSRVAASQFLIPLSYASILGSVTTIIGTSTILTVTGMVLDAGLEPWGFFEPAPVGILVALAGMLYLVFVSPSRLPIRIEAAEELDDRSREYTSAMRVTADSPLHGMTVEEANLRNLPGLFLVELDRGTRLITPVSPDQSLQTGDILVFAGVLTTIIDLQRIRGLEPAAPEDLIQSLPGGRNRPMVEAVVSASSPLIGQSVKLSNFRSVYDAVVIAVHRNAERVQGKIGDIVLRPGDTLLMQCAPEFMRLHHNSRDFYLASELPGADKPDFERARIALGILVVMVLVVALGGVHISIAAFVTVAALIGTRCLSATKARQSVDWSVLITIGAGLGIANAMTQSGAASFVAHGLVSAVGAFGPFASLLVIYALCLLMAETLHHNAAVAIMFPIALAASTQLGVDSRPFVMTVAIASACAFASPVSYQTHLIVYGAGGYRFREFMRVGIPLDLICAAVALTAIPWFWPF